MSKDDDVGDRDLWQRYAAPPATPIASSCPEEGTLAALLDGRVEAGERDHLEAHLARCPRCVAALGDALRAERLPVSPLTAGHLERLTRVVLAEQAARLSLPGWIAVAAVLVLTCGAGFLLGARTVTDTAAIGKVAGDIPFDLSPVVTAP